MIIEKVKQMGIAVVITLIGLGTVTTALCAYQAAPADSGVLKENKPTQDGERSKTQETKVVPTAKSDADDGSQREKKERLASEAENEMARQTLDRELADAALLQMELDITRKRIEKSTDSLINQESPNTNDEAEHIRIFKRRDRMERQLGRYKNMYTEKWILLARLKRAIARQSKSLGVAADSSPNGMDLGRRLDELEQKIDRIIDSLPAK